MCLISDLPGLQMGNSITGGSFLAKAGESGGNPGTLLVSSAPWPDPLARREGAAEERFQGRRQRPRRPAGGPSARDVPIGMMTRLRRRVKVGQQRRRPRGLWHRRPRRCERALPGPGHQAMPSRGRLGHSLGMTPGAANRARRSACFRKRKHGTRQGCSVAAAARFVAPPPSAVQSVAEGAQPGAAGPQDRIPSPPPHLRNGVTR